MITHTAHMHSLTWVTRLSNPSILWTRWLPLQSGQIRHEHWSKQHLQDITNNNSRDHLMPLLLINYLKYLLEKTLCLSSYNFSQRFYSKSQQPLISRALLHVRGVWDRRGPQEIFTQSLNKSNKCAVIQGWKQGHRPVNFILNDFPSTLAISIIAHAEHWSQKKHQDDDN